MNRQPGRLSYREREGRFTCRRENTLRRSNSSRGACVRSRTEDMRGEVSRELPPGRVEGRLGRRRKAEGGQRLGTTSTPPRERPDVRPRAPCAGSLPQVKEKPGKGAWRGEWWEIICMNLG